MFSINSKSSNIENIQAPAQATNSHFVTNKKLTSIIEKKKREPSNHKKTLLRKETVSSFLIEGKDILETNMSLFSGQEINNIS